MYEKYIENEIVAEEYSNELINIFKAEKFGDESELADNGAELVVEKLDQKIAEESVISEDADSFIYVKNLEDEAANKTKLEYVVSERKNDEEAYRVEINAISEDKNLEATAAEATAADLVYSKRKEAEAVDAAKVAYVNEIEVAERAESDVQKQIAGVENKETNVEATVAEATAADYVYYKNKEAETADAAKVAYVNELKAAERAESDVQKQIAGVENKETNVEATVAEATAADLVYSAHKFSEVVDIATAEYSVEDNTAESDIFADQQNVAAEINEQFVIDENAAHESKIVSAYDVSKENAEADEAKVEYIIDRESDNLDYSELVDEDSKREFYNARRAALAEKRKLKMDDVLAKFEDDAKAAYSVSKYQEEVEDAVAADEYADVKSAGEATVIEKTAAAATKEAKDVADDATRATEESAVYADSKYAEEVEATKAADAAADKASADEATKIVSFMN